MTASFQLRPDTPADRPFLRRVYAGIRAQELAQVDWPDEQKQTFVDMQFEAQDRHYREHSAGADFLVIEAEGADVGRLVVQRTDDEIHIVDIALLPEHRGKGTGGALLGSLLAEARATARPVRIHVERMNRARTLYDRLGFVPIAEGDVYDLMEWRAPATSPTDDAG